MRKHRLLCVDLLIDGADRARGGSPTVCRRLFDAPPGELPTATPYRVSFGPRQLPRLIAALTEVQRILTAAVPVPPDPAPAAASPSSPSLQELPCDP